MILGIDPGLTGGFVVLFPSGKLYLLYPMPVVGNEIDIFHVNEFLKMVRDSLTICYLEKSQPFPRIPAQVNFKVGKAFAIIETLLIVNKIPYHLTPPVTWTKEMHKGIKKELKSKEKSLLAAKRLFPDIEKLAATKSGKILDGLIDAALIGLYGLNKDKGE